MGTVCGTTRLNANRWRHPNERPISAWVALRTWTTWEPKAVYIQRLFPTEGLIECFPDLNKRYSWENPVPWTPITSSNWMNTELKISFNFNFELILSQFSNYCRSVGNSDRRQKVSVVLFNTFIVWVICLVNDSIISFMTRIHCNIK